jgi:UDP-N-acetylmuramate--alanine ligase
LLNDFATSFSEADEVIVSEIYASREARQDFSAEKVVKSMARDSAHYIPGLAEISSYLIDHLKSGDVLIVMSAGDADQVSAQVLAHLQNAQNTLRTK